MDVPGGEVRQVNVQMQAGQRMEGRFTVKGGDIGFAIKKPSGGYAMNDGRVPDRAFAILALETGTYTLVFDNSYAPGTAKAVDLSVSVS